VIISSKPKYERLKFKTMKRNTFLIITILFIITININAQTADTTICYEYTTLTDSIQTSMGIRQYDANNNLILDFEKHVLLTNILKKIGICLI